MDISGMYNYQDVFDRVNQLQVWSDIIQHHVEIGQMICNPLRSDNTPNCYLREYNNIVFMTDFAFPEYNTFTCVHAVAKLNNLRLNKAAKLIIKKYLFKQKIDFNTVPTYVSKTVRQTVINKDFKFTPYVNKDNKPTFTKKDAQYWTKRGITSQQLRNHNVYSVHSWSYNNYHTICRKPCYAYHDPVTNKTKLYQPTSNRRFPYSSMDKNHINCGNTHITSDICIITKSLKDLMVLENLFSDINVFSVEAESMIPDDLSMFDKYKAIYVLYDNDKAGIEGSAKMVNALNNAYSIYVNIDGCKDVDDVVVNKPDEIDNFVNYINGIMARLCTT